MTRRKKADYAQPILLQSKIVPLNMLFVSNRNVRQTATDENLDELGNDIIRQGLLYPLIIEAELDETGAETGRYGVIAGGRRYRALQKKAIEKIIAKDYPVKCEMREAGSTILAEDTSLAENVQRLGLHPIDQFYAFMALMEKGMSETEIAAAYYVTELVVKQRIRLAKVAPEILDEYRNKKLTLDQVIAFSVCDDHERQLQVLDFIKEASFDYQRAPHNIRSMLMEKTVKMSDPRANFVGLDAYLAASGPVTRDLFGDEDDTYLENPALLETLFNEKLEAEAANLKNQGWKWVKPLYERYNAYRNTHRRLVGHFPELSDEEYAARQKLWDDLNTLEAEYEEYEDYNEAIETRLEELNDQLAAYENRPPVYDEEQKAISGAFVYVNNEGQIHIDCGYIDPADEETSDVDDDNQETMEDMDEDDDEPEEDELDTSLSGRLITNLTQHQTQALRNKLAKYPDTALCLLLHCFVKTTFATNRSYDSNHILQITIRNDALVFGNDILKATAYGAEIEDRFAEYYEMFDDLDDHQLWATLQGMSLDEKLTLLTFCISTGLNVVEGKAMSNSYLQKRREQKYDLMNALDFNMREEGWLPTANSYFSMLNKKHILDIIAEVKDPTTARHLSSFKKDVMIREAERITQNTDWLPSLLCRPTIAKAHESEDVAEAIADNLTETPETALEAAE
ncbi:ParB/RepB/Spo0J family partition protein [Bartonella sp. LJL80]